MESDKTFSDKVCLENSDIMLRDDKKMITGKKKLVELFNHYYINIVEWSCSLNAEKVEFDFDLIGFNFLDKYRNHPSIVKIHKNRNLQSSSIPISSFSRGSKITPKEFNSILKFLNSKKAPGIDKIPAKLAILVSGILAEPLSIAINNSISPSTFPSHAKIATVVPIDKTTDVKYVISNFRPLSIVNCFSKVNENIRML